MPENRIGKDKEFTGVKKEHFQILWPFLKKHWPKAFLGVVVVLFSSLLSYPQPLIQRFFIDNVILARQMKLLPIVIIVFLTIQILSKGSNIFQKFFFTRYEQELMLDLRHNLLSRVLHFPKSFFDKKETGYLMSRLSSDVGGLRWFFSTTIVSIFTNALRFFVGIGFLFYLEWRLALAAIVGLPALAFLVRFFSRKVRALSHSNMERGANVSKRMQEMLSSIPLIKSFVAEKRELNRVMDELKASQSLALERSVLDSVSNLSMGVVKDIAKYLVMVVGAIMIIRGNWTLGSLIAFQSYLGFVYGPANFFAQTNFSLQRALVSLERLGTFYKVVPEENKSTGYDVKHLKGEIEFQAVTFSYDGSETVLENISFNIKPGTRAAIVGPSGVGKSTLISLILGFYQPAEGQILFDNKALSEYALDSLRKRIGYVSQSTRLLSGTILLNLKYGNIDATQEEVITAATAAGIHDFIAAQPDGYNSTLGENGINLSEGQRQRLSIARALVKDPDILLLDEPTSSLDSLIEKSIFASLPNLVSNKTLIVVAHRLSTVQDSDQILVLRNKKLIAVGTHHNLSQNNEFYQSLVSNQQIITST
ncbi:MAG: ABC transporter ATP-binding protein [Candidatus Saganbacteria bacterium]|nr:ABC transporter ATP-binding protein [Candidatus Saganbacteria bacterium]